MTAQALSPPFQFYRKIHDVSAEIDCFLLGQRRPTAQVIVMGDTATEPASGGRKKLRNQWGWGLGRSGAGFESDGFSTEGDYSLGV